MPVRLTKLKKALKAHGVRVEPPNRGSHWRLVRGSLLFPVPAHNGLKSEISERYIQSACRLFGIPRKDLPSS